MNIVDELAPLAPFDENAGIKVKKIPPFVKNKINLRKRLLMLEKKRNSVELAPSIKILSKLIGDYFANDKAARVRSLAMGAKVNLLRAVNVAKNVNSNTIPKNLTLGVCLLQKGAWLSHLQNFLMKRLKATCKKLQLIPT